jgi:hypothetical protein
LSRHVLLSLCLLWAPAAFAATLGGTVTDRSGGALAGARVLVLTAQRSVVATTSTGERGTFSVTGLPDGSYVVIAQYPSLADRQAAVVVRNPSPRRLT